MKKNDVFQFTAPNGVVVTAIVLNAVESYNEAQDKSITSYLCYAQNRLFTYYETIHHNTSYDYDDAGNIIEDTSSTTEESYGEVIVEYCILPEQDRLLESFNGLYD